MGAGKKTRKTLDFLSLNKCVGCGPPPTFIPKVEEGGCGGFFFFTQLGWSNHQEKNLDVFRAVWVVQVLSWLRDPEIKNPPRVTRCQGHVLGSRWVCRVFCGGVLMGREAGCPWPICGTRYLTNGGRGMLQILPREVWPRSFGFWSCVIGPFYYCGNLAEGEGWTPKHPSTTPAARFH